VNNTQKLDDIRRRMRRVEARLAIIQRACILVAEYVRGPVLITEQERKILRSGDAGLTGERGQEV
jgi:hypothetical protein